MNKSAGLVDALKSIGLIPQDGRDYSYIDDAAKNSLIGAGIGSAGLAGVGALMSDEQDPEKRKLNLRNNLLMGAGLGAGGGLAASGFRHQTNSIPTGLESHDKPFRSLYRMGRAGQSLLTNTGVGGISGAIARHFHNKGSKATAETLGKIVQDGKLNFDPRFPSNPDVSGSDIAAKDFGKVPKEIPERFNNFMMQAERVGGIKNPQVVKQVINMLHANPDQVRDMSFDRKDLMDNGVLKPDSSLYDKGIAKTVATSKFPLRFDPYLDRLLPKLPFQHVDAIRSKLLGGANNPVLNRQGNIWARMAAAISRGHYTPTNTVEGSMPLDGPNMFSRPLEGSNMFSRGANYLNKTFNPTAPVYEQRLSNYAHRGFDALVKDNEGGFLRGIGKYIPGTPFGRYNRSGLQAGLRMGLPAAATSYGISQLAPETTDPMFGGQELKQTLTEGGLQGRIEQNKQMLQQHLQQQANAPVVPPSPALWSAKH